MNGSGDGSPAAPRGVTGRLERMIRKPARRRHAARPDRAPIRPASCVLCGGALDSAGSHPAGEPGDGGVRADTAPGWPVTGETAVPPAACTCRTEGGSITAPGGARANEAGLVLRPPLPAPPGEPPSGRPGDGPGEETPGPAGGGSPIADDVATAVAEADPVPDADGDARRGPAPGVTGPLSIALDQAEHGAGPEEPAATETYAAAPETDTAEPPAPPAAAPDGGDDDTNGPTEAETRRPGRPPAPMLAAAVLAGVVLGSVPFAVSRVNLSDDHAQRTVSHDLALDGTRPAGAGSVGSSDNSGFVPRVNAPDSAGVPAAGRTGRPPTDTTPGRSPAQEDPGTSSPVPRPTTTARPEPPADPLPLSARKPSEGETRPEPRKAPVTGRSPKAREQGGVEKKGGAEKKGRENAAAEGEDRGASAHPLAAASDPSPEPSVTPPREQVAGPGCQNTATASYQEHGRFEDGEDGWLGGSGDGPECGGAYASVPMSGDPDVADPDVSTTWTFDPGPRTRCTLYVFVPEDDDVARVGGDPTYYTVFAGPEGDGEEITGFRVDQVDDRGYWVEQEEFTPDGVFTVRLDNRGVGDADDQEAPAHHAAGPIKAYCD